LEGCWKLDKGIGGVRRVINKIETEFYCMENQEYINLRQEIIQSRDAQSEIAVV